MHFKLQGHCYVRNLPFDVSHVPPILPDAEYMIQFVFMCKIGGKEVYIFSFKLDGQLKRTTWVN